MRFYETTLWDTWDDEGARHQATGCQVLASPPELNGREIYGGEECVPSSEKGSQGSWLEGKLRLLGNAVRFRYVVN